MNALDKYQIIQHVVQNNGNKSRAAIVLNNSKRNINNLVRRFDENDSKCFVHKNKGKMPHNKTPKEDSEKIVKLKTGKYKLFNIKHFSECLVRDEGIKVNYWTVKRILNERNIFTKCTRKETIKKYEAKLKEEKKFKDLAIFTDESDCLNLIQVKSDRHCRIPNEPKFGYIVEADASVFRFFGNIPTYLHLFVDRYTGAILAGYFDFQETLFGYQNAFFNLVQKHGIPMKLVTDKRTVFTYKRIKGDSETCKLTQFGFWSEQLGMELYCTSTSQKKPMVERANRIMQDRLTAIFSLYDDIDINKANEMLPKLIDEINASLGYNWDGIDNVFEQYDEKRFGLLELMLAIRQTRLFANGCVFSYENILYQAMDCNTKKIMNFKPRTQVMILKTPKQDMILSIGNKFFNMVEYHKEGRLAIENVGFPPLPNHPWFKVKSFVQFKLENPVRSNELFEIPIKSTCYNY